MLSTLVSVGSFLHCIMATPVKSAALALVRNALSPRTPNFLTVPVSPKYINQCSPRRSTSFKQSDCNKRLDFSHTAAANNNGSRLDVVDNIKIALSIDEHQIEHRRPENIFINTPMKIDLMRNGLNYKTKELDVLGRGSFGTVVRGSYKNKVVAVKVIEMKNSSSRPSDFHAQKLSHKNIVQIFELIMKPQEKFAVIIMEYLEGTRDLQSILDTCFQLSWSAKRKYIQDVCTGLQYCHENGIFHLDIKPKNILISENRECKICDFGNSCITENVENYKFQGTVAYAAPELLRGMKPTRKCDIYSIGITIWQMEYKKVPYEEWGCSEAVLYKVVKHDARPKYKPKDDVVTLLFESCWHKDPFCRPEIGEIFEFLKMNI